MRTWPRSRARAPGPGPHDARARYPPTDQAKAAVVVSSEADHRERPDLIILAVTSQVRAEPGVGEAAIGKWKQAGLLKPSVGGLGKAAYSVCYVSHSTCAVLDLFRDIARGFAIEPRYRKADGIRDVKDRIVKLSRGQKIQPVLIVDDAHLLPTHVLDDLRLLTSFDADSRDELTMVLCGHAQLESNLRLAINEALAQRIVLRVRLRSLHPQEVQDYLRFRLDLAGRSAKLFLPDAVEAIARASCGIPRLIDRLAEHSMLLALRAHRTEIDAEIVSDAIDEVDP